MVRKTNADTEVFVHQSHPRFLGSPAAISVLIIDTTFGSKRKVFTWRSRRSPEGSMWRRRTMFQKFDLDFISGSIFIISRRASRSVRVIVLSSIELLLF